MWRLCSGSDSSVALSAADQNATPCSRSGTSMTKWHRRLRCMINAASDYVCRVDDADAMGLIFASTTERPSGSARTRNRPHVASWTGHTTGSPFALASRSQASGSSTVKRTATPPTPKPAGKGPTFVMAPVVAVQHDPPGLASHHRDDLVLEQHRQSERAGVERLRRREVGDEQDQALEMSDTHGINLASTGRTLA